jgi:hypothetical protein
MRTLSLTLAMLLASPVAVAFAAPRHHRSPKARTVTAESAAGEAFIAECVHERTGPTGGITVKAALKLCTGIVRHQSKIAKAAARARKAIEACEQTVVDACVDAAATDGSTDCEDAALRPAFNAACFAQEGK